MKLIYVLGPAHGRVEEFTPTLGSPHLPPEHRKQPLGRSELGLGELFVTYVVAYFDKDEAYYIPHIVGKGHAIKLLANMVGESNES